MSSIDKLAWILVKDKRVLYVRSKGKDLFFNPGGKREAGETDEEALMREVKEELGVSLVPESIRYVITVSAQAAGKPEGVMVEMKCFTADYSGTLTPRSEIEELAWFSSTDVHRTSAAGKLILEYLKNKNIIE